jgi:type VI secretion system protein ImpA
MPEPLISHTPPQWLLPVTDAQPCGPSLEYDADYAVLVARMQRRGEAQYGEFIDTDDAPDWPEVERQCRDLLARTRDISVLIWLCRARVRVAQSAGLAQGLGMLADVLEQWPNEVHPQVIIDGAQRSIRNARHWFELHEPSSPVAVLLKQAERLVGRRFAEVADAIPLDLLQKWDAQGTDDTAHP